MGIRGEFSARRQRLFYIFLFHGHYGGEKGDVASRINSVRLFLTYVSVRYSDTLKISQVSRDKKCRKNSISVNIYININMRRQRDYTSLLPLPNKLFRFDYLRF